jgi:hypothetical protein
LFTGLFLNLIKKRFFLKTLINAETVETNLIDDTKPEDIFSHCKEHSITAFIKQTYFKLALPMSAVPCFTTEFSLFFL